MRALSKSSRGVPPAYCRAYTPRRLQTSPIAPFSFLNVLPLLQKPQSPDRRSSINTHSSYNLGHALLQLSAVGASFSIHAPRRLSLRCAPYRCPIHPASPAAVAWIFELRPLQKIHDCGIPVPSQPGRQVENLRDRDVCGVSLIAWQLDRHAMVSAVVSPEAEDLNQHRTSPRSAGQ